MGGFNLRGLVGWGVVQQVKAYLSPYYCEHLRIHPWGSRGRVKAHISKSKLGASIHPEKQNKKKKQVTSCSACHVPQVKEISVVDFKANDMPGTLLPTVSTMTVGLKRTAVLVKESQGPPGSLVHIPKLKEQKDQNGTSVRVLLKSRHYFKLKRILLNGSHGLLQGFSLFRLIVRCTAGLFFVEWGSKVKPTKEQIMGFSVFQDECYYFQGNSSINLRLFCCWVIDGAEAVPRLRYTKTHRDSSSSAEINHALKKPPPPKKKKRKQGYLTS